MSGIYIPGMEMPETCFECPFMFARRYCCADLTLDLYQGDYDEIKSRVDGCPLVPVPDHGRLMDADVFEKKNAYFWGRDFRNAKYEDCLCDLVNAAPTVIPADPADKEGER